MFCVAIDHVSGFSRSGKPEWKNTLEINLSGHAVHSAQSTDCVRLARSDRIFYSPLSFSETSVADISTKS